jgi:hypothetical protein
MQQDALLCIRLNSKLLRRLNHLRLFVIMKKISESDFKALRAEVGEIKSLLNKIDHDDLISEETLIKKLGNPNRSTLWRWQKKGILKPIKVGSSKMYRLSDLLNLKETL